MKCQEVMEDMQRQLDGDLNDLESEALMTHLRHCPDCAAMYDRLQILSSGLENLPKVAPPYSIVDAILPKLAELSKAQAEGEADIIPAATETLPKPVQEPVERRLKRERRWLDRFSIRALGGVVAAGIVAGLFLVTYNTGSNDELSTAQEAQMSATADSSASSSAPEMDRAASDDAAPVESAGKADGGEVSTSSANSDKRTAKESDTPKEIYRDTATGSMESRNTADGGGASAEPSSGEAEGPASGAGKSPNQVFTVTTEQNSGDTIAEQKSQEVQNKDKNSGTDTKDSNDSKMFGISQISNDFVSPDGKYKASIDPDRNILNVYAQADMTLVLQTEEAPGGIGAIAWAEDSQTLTYDAIAQDGTSTTYRIDIEAGTITALQNTP